MFTALLISSPELPGHILSYSRGTAETSHLADGKESLQITQVSYNSLGNEADAAIEGIPVRGRLSKRAGYWRAYPLPMGIQLVYTTPSPEANVQECRRLFTAAERTAWECGVLSWWRECSDWWRERGSTQEGSLV